tara:strand:- start:113 stop:367 length:255 start_codon:yes stop_codon:yes gene_type:complete
MPHFIFGITKTHFLGLFGYSTKGNIAYAILQLALSVILFLIQYNFEDLASNGDLIGALVILVSYLFLGKTMLKKFNQKTTQTPS